MEELIKEINERTKRYSEEQVEFTPYCTRKMGERQIDRETIISALFSNNLFFVEIQKKQYLGNLEERHKLIFKLSSRYSLIIIVLYCERVLKVINVIKTSKDMEKKWRKKILG